ncbi:lytic murein transglycosylase [Rhizobium fabae]|uniref:Lytic murein transglycosylase n=1 Tax=Rhizobium fabae TaxID=573179 RepID=A0ABY0B7M5_9HYPH|nr:lytic murein transglycosylase [Rhizobium fabae]
MFLGVTTPLCPAGHLPHTGGDRQDAPASRNLDRAPSDCGYLRRLIRARGRFCPISPLVGEMPVRAEGGAPSTVDAESSHI